MGFFYLYTMKRLLILKEGETTVKDVLASWGIYTKHVPFNPFPKLKEPPKNSWYDEDGDDEFLPATPRYEAYEMAINFIYKGAAGTANAKIRQFIDFLQGAYMSIYDEHSLIGRQKVRYVSTEDDATLLRRSDIDVVEFTVNFKVNDPKTDITLTL